MAADNVLREFLVSLGFKVDEEQHKKFQYGLRVSTQGVEGLGLAITSVSGALGAAMERIADQFEHLYYTAQLTGATAAQLRDLGFAAGQVGASAEAMRQALRNVHVLLQSPGGEAQIRAFTGYRGAIKDSDQALKILLKHWHDLYANGNPFLARLEAQVLGFNVTALEPLILNFDRYNEALEEHRRRWAAIDTKKLAKDSVELGNAWRSLSDEILYWPTIFTERFIGPFTDGVTSATKLIEELRHDFEGLDKTTQNTALGIGGVTTALIGIVGAAGAARTALRILGIGGKVAVLGEGAGAAGAGLFGGSFLSALLPALLGVGLADLATSGPGSKEWVDKVNRQHKDFWGGIYKFFHPNNPNRGYPAFTPGAYEVPSGAPGLFHRAAFRSDAESDLRDWLHGSVSFVPAVRMISGDQPNGDTGIFNASYEPGGGLGASSGLGSPRSQLGLPPSLVPGGRVGDLSASRAALAQRLYLHARAPVSAGGLGLDRAHTLAMLGNAFAESGLNPHAIGDHGTSHGLFQWHADRAVAIFRALGGHRDDPIAQLDYAVREQMKRGPGFFRQKGSVKDLTNMFERDFERPARLVDRNPYAEAISRTLGAIGDTRLGAGSVHHHAGDKSVSINAPVNVTVHGGDAHAVASAVGSAHRRTLGDAVRNLAPIMQ